mgnify:FL=1
MKFIQKGKKSIYKASPKEEKSNTIVILIKLLETNKTANNLLGVFLSVLISFRLLSFELFAFLRSVLLREKNATSEPDIRADENNKKTINAIFNAIAEESVNKGRKIEFN